MTPGGWINLVVSVSFVTGLFGWCLWRVAVASRSRGERDGVLGHIEPVEEDIADER